MSKPVQAVSLNILGKEYKIACAPGEEDALIRSANQLDRQMRKIRDTGKVAGADRIAVLAALNLAHDAGATPANQPLSDEHIGSRIRQMLEKIENALENP